MRRLSIVLVLVMGFAVSPWVVAQEAGPAAGGHEMQEHMMAMHRREMEGMRGDIERMKLALAQLKANVPLIRNTSEKAMWQSNVDLWEVMLAHMENMAGHMDGMGIGMGHGMGPGMGEHGAPPPAPAGDKKPE